MDDPRRIAERILANVRSVILGKDDEVRLALIALMCHGHVLIDDVPGVGKTMLARALARSTGCSFKRIQCTPDLLPTDITGVSIYNQKTGDFQFRPGPVFAQIILADEINRATPKAQSALLEAMEERQVTAEGMSYQVPHPFMVMATQNPIEFEGTFPLPEAELDRFLMRIRLGYPAHEAEVKILEGQRLSHPIHALEQVTTPEELLALQEAVRHVYVDPLIRHYVVGLAAATREHDCVYVGASPRGSLALTRTAQALAMLESRDYVSPDDVKALALPVLEHRLIMHPAARVKSISPGDIVAECLSRVAVPGGSPGGDRHFQQQPAPKVER